MLATAVLLTYSYLLLLTYSYLLTLTYLQIPLIPTHSYVSYVCVCVCVCVCVFSSLRRRRRSYCGNRPHVRAADGWRRRLLGLEWLRAAGDRRHERQIHADGGDGAGGRWQGRAHAWRVHMSVHLYHHICIYSELLCDIICQCNIFRILLYSYKMFAFSCLMKGELALCVCVCARARTRAHARKLTCVYTHARTRKLSLQSRTKTWLILQSSQTLLHG